MVSVVDDARVLKFLSYARHNQLGVQRVLVRLVALLCVVIQSS